MEFNCTPAEEVLLSTLESVLEELERDKGLKGSKGFNGRETIKDVKDLDGLKILVAGYNSGLLPCALAKAGANVTIHAFDRHNARTAQSRIAEAHLENPPAVQCTPQIPSGPYARAYLIVTPLAMTGELVLDQLEDIRANLAEGGELFAAFEGDAEESLKAMKKVFARVHVLPTPTQSRRSRRRGELSLFRVVKGDKDAAAPRRNFSSDWTASVPGGETRTFTSLPGCFCHRRADQGGLALAETACSLLASNGLADLGSIKVLDMGCGCGFVGLLVADFLRSRGATVVLTLVDSHARALAAARINAERLGFADATFLLSDDGLPPDEAAGFDLFLGNPPYYGDWRIAELFLATASKALKPGGRCLTVAKNEGGLKEIQSRIFGETAVIRRRGYCVFSSIRA